MVPCVSDGISGAATVSENSVPQWMGWMSNGFLLVLYENRAVLYNTSGGSAGERASYDFGGGTLVSVSNTGNGRPCC